MKVLTLAVLFCCIVPAFCVFTVDDWQVPVSFINVVSGSGVTESRVTSDSNLYFARRITTYRHSPGQVEVDVGSGSAEITCTPTFNINDYNIFEYWYGTTALNFPPGTTSSLDPYPLGYVDFSWAEKLVIDAVFSDSHPSVGFWFLSRDANGVEYTTPGRNFLNTDTHIEVPIDDVFLVNYIDRTRVTYFGFYIFTGTTVITNFYFQGACENPSNIDSSSAIEIPFDMLTPASVSIDTCGYCVPGDFGTFQVPSIVRNNVYWYSIPQQNIAYTVSFSSTSFSGIDDAFLYVYNAQGNLIAEIDNLSSAAFELTLPINEVAIFIAFGADCSLQTYSLDISFSGGIEDIFLALQELQEDLTALSNAGFADIASRLAAISTKIDQSTGNIIDEINLTETDVEGLVTTETNEIDANLASLSTSLGGVDQNLSDRITNGFSALDTSLDSRFGDVSSDLGDISDQIDDQCGSAADGVGSLTSYLTAQWDNWNDQEIIEKLVPGALVPAIFQTPASQGGYLENIYAFVTTTFDEKKAIADSQKTTPTSTTCKSGANGAYCTFFYRFPTGTGSALSTYQSAIASYNSWIAQYRYAKAFQSLASAYNAIFMGQI